MGDAALYAMPSKRGGKLSSQPATRRQVFADSSHDSDSQIKFGASFAAAHSAACMYYTSVFVCRNHLSGLFLRNYRVSLSPYGVTLWGVNLAFSKGFQTRFDGRGRNPPLPAEQDRARQLTLIAGGLYGADSDAESLRGLRGGEIGLEEPLDFRYVHAAIVVIALGEGNRWRRWSGSETRFPRRLSRSHNRFQLGNRESAV
jgi:hypothetical protein